MAKNMEENGARVESDLNKFFPLPFRVLFLLSLSVYLWYSVVFLCTRLTSINILQLLNLSYNGDNYTTLENTLPNTGEYGTTVSPNKTENERLLYGIRKTMKWLTLSFGVSYSICMIIKLNYDSDNDSWADLIPSKTYKEHLLITLLYFVLIFTALVYFFVKVFHKKNALGQLGTESSSGQCRVYTTAKRVILGRINSLTMRTNDILFSDSLVSYNRVLADLSLLIMGILGGFDIAGANSSSNSIPVILVEAFFLCSPHCIRIAQCRKEYKLTGEKQHAYNMLKYFCGTLAIISNSALKMNTILQKREGAGFGNQEPGDNLLRWFYFFAFISSTYSFLWDLIMDWGFELKTFGGRNFLRADYLLFSPNSILYYGIIFADFSVRFIWILRAFQAPENNSAWLGSAGNFFFGGGSLSLGYFAVEAFEISRRWLWCLIKIENDWIKLHFEAKKDFQMYPVSDKRRA